MGTIVIIGRESVIRRIGTVPRIAERPDMDDVRLFLDKIRYICGKGDHNLIVDTIPGPGHLEGWVRGAQHAGWACTDSALQHRSGWTVLQREGTTLHALVGQTSQHCPLAPPEGESRQIANNFELFRHLMGVRWRISGGVTLHAAIRESLRRQSKRPPLPGVRGGQMEPLWHWAPQDRILGASSPMWRLSHRALAALAREGDLTHVHHLDVRAQFLAAMAAAELPRGGMESVGGSEFDPACAGYWRIRCDQMIAPVDRPSLIGLTRLSNRRATITTPLMGLVASGAQEISWEIEDSIRPESSGRFLRKIAEHIRDAQKACGEKPQFVKAFKEMYTQGIGMFASASGMISRQDWRDTIVDLAAANLHRKINKIPAGYQLLEVRSDSLYIAGPESPEGLKEAMTGPRIGHLRHMVSMPLKEYLERTK